MAALASCGWHLNGQTAIDLTRQGRLSSGTTLPAQCAVGQIFFKSNAPPGANLYACIALNSWTTVGLSQGAAASRPANCAFGQIWLSTDTGAMTYCSVTGSPGTWSPTLGGGSGSGVPTGGSAGQVLAKNSNTDNDTHWVTNTGSGSGAVLTPVSYSATPAFTVSASSTPQMFAMTLTGNVTSSTLTTTSAMAGQTIGFILTQDGSGSHAFAWPSNVLGACAISSTASISTTVTGVFDGSNVRAIGCTSNDPATIVALGPTRSALPVPAAGTVGCWLDSTANTQICQDSSGNAFTMVKSESPASHQFVAYVDAGGLQHLSAIAAGDLPAGATQTIASGTASLGTSTIASGSCATPATAAATGTQTTDVVLAGFNGDPTGINGYLPGTTGMLTIIAYPTSDNVNFTVCNNSTASITPGAITLNWKVVR